MTVERLRCISEFTCLGNGTDLGRSLVTGEVRPLRTSAAATAELCLEPRTPDDHVTHVCAELGLGEERRADLLGLLEALRDDGFVASDADLLAALRARGPEGRPARIDTIGILTCNRPRGLLRCARSYLSAARAAGRTVRLVVADGSPDPDAVRKNRAIVHLLRIEGVDAIRIGSWQKRELADHLVRQGASRDTVRFALSDPYRLGTPIGGNRNALALVTAGRPVLSSDDDMVARLFEAPDAEHERLVVTSDEPERHLALFGAREDVLAGAPAATVDLLGTHERLLGRTVADLARVFPSVDLGVVASLRELLTDAVTVRVTAAGTAGDSGMGSSTWMLAERGRHEAWFTTPAAFAGALATRELLRVAPSSVVTDRPDLMAGTLGLDQRRVLPPFFPVLRNEDGLFGHHLRALERSGRIGVCPVAVLHAPLEVRAQRADAVLLGAGRMGLGEVVLHALATAPALPARGGFGPLGDWFRELGGLASASLEEWLRLGHARRCSAEEHGLRSLLETHGEDPPWWSATVRAYLDLVAERAAGGAWIPAECAHGRTARNAVTLVGRVLRSWGDLLSAWPSLVAAARTWDPDAADLT